MPRSMSSRVPHTGARSFPWLLATQATVGAFLWGSGVRMGQGEAPFYSWALPQESPLSGRRPESNSPSSVLP